MDTVLTSTQDGILSITLNRPEKKNALTNEMYFRLDQALIEAEDNDDIRVVLLRSNGAAFSAGNDLRDFAAFSLSESSRVQDLPMAHFMLRVVQFEKPLVAAVQGLALGFGCALLLHCDTVIAARNAGFGLPFPRLGLVPLFGSTLLLPAMAGRSRARYHMLTGDTFDANTALQLGIVHELWEAEEVHARALAVCRHLCTLPTRTLHTIKHLTHAIDQRSRLLETIEAELKAFDHALRSPEHHEAVTAFFEKRSPEFRNIV